MSSNIFFSRHYAASHLWEREEKRERLQENILKIRKLIERERQRDHPCKKEEYYLLRPPRHPVRKAAFRQC